MSKCSECGTEENVMDITVAPDVIWRTCHNCFLLKMIGTPVKFKGKVIGHVTSVVDMGVEMKLSK